MPDFAFETECRVAGIWPVAGIDEAGRGPLAGPVVAAAVILPSPDAVVGLQDSKKLSASARSRIYESIIAHPGILWAVGLAEREEIDRINILRATHLAMARASNALRTPPAMCLIDGLPVRDFPWPSKAIVKGDSISQSISAASIIAKVTRDRIMAQLDAEYPMYGFSRNQGYGTKEHLAALRQYGPCPEHRQSFGPVAQPGLF